MERFKEYKKVKEIIAEFFERAECGIFNTKNIVNDRMFNIFRGKYFKVDICLEYAYFEVFGTTPTEFDELKGYYERIREKNEW